MDTEYTANDTSNNEFDVVKAITSRKLMPEQRLAAEVLLNAVQECRRTYLREGLERARRIPAYFDLAYPQNMVKFWCQAIDLDPDRMAARFRKNMRHEQSAKRMFKAFTDQGARGK